jgi:hypothetical protein
MSYRPANPTGTDPSVFYGYRSTSVNITTAGTIIPLTDTSSGNTIVSGAIDFGSTRQAFCTGEVQVTNGSTLQLCDIKMVTNDGSAAEGYQVRNNANGTVLMDDACYGITYATSVSVYVDKIAAARDLDSDANETRVIGVFTQ